jgi:hypothetical protein
MVAPILNKTAQIGTSVFKLRANRPYFSLALTNIPTKKYKLMLKKSMMPGNAIRKAKLLSQKFHEANFFTNRNSFV